MINDYEYKFISLLAKKGSQHTITFPESVQRKVKRLIKQGYVRVEDGFDGEKYLITEAGRLAYEVKKYVVKQNITCAETIYQTDRVIINAYEFMDKIFKMVGFVKGEDDE